MLFCADAVKKTLSLRFCLAGSSKAVRPSVFEKAIPQALHAASTAIPFRSEPLKAIERHPAGTGAKRTAGSFEGWQTTHASSYRAAGNLLGFAAQRIRPQRRSSFRHARFSER